MASEKELVSLLATIRYELSDSKALTFQKMYPKWKEGITITAEDLKQGKDRFQYGDKLYKCIQAHTTQAEYTPDLTPALFVIIDATHKGTIDDPIPVPEVITNFEYEWGKYYLENDVLYLCDRQGGAEGDKYELTFKPSQLEGIYFSKVE